MIVENGIENIRYNHSSTLLSIPDEWEDKFLIYYVIDAFTAQQFGGNPAGVVIYEQADEAFMQKFAAEVRFSETAFIKQLDKKTFDIKFFTPTAQVDLCGHATIASFKALLHAQLIEQNHTYYMKTTTGTLPVDVQDSFIMMEQGEPKLGKTFGNEELAKLFHIDERVIGYEHAHLVPQAASTGLWDIILPIKTKEALYALQPDFEAIKTFTEAHDVAGIHAFTLDTVDGLAESRNFCPRYGIDEEAATGTSTGALTYYLYKNELLPTGTHTFLQGHSMDRPSTIMTRMEPDTQKILVGGQAVILVKGELF